MNLLRALISMLPKPPGAARQRGSKYIPHQGKRECERRRKQFERLSAKRGIAPALPPHVPVNRECPDCGIRGMHMGHYNDQRHHIKCIHCGHEWVGRILSKEVS